MNFLDLDPHFLRHKIKVADKHHGRVLKNGKTQWGGFPTSTFEYVRKIRNADGVGFLCPKCYEANGGEVGTHGIRVYFRGSSVPGDIGTNKDGKTVRWDASGKGLGDLTLAPSILLQGGCNWHGYVRNGQTSNA